MLEPTRPGHAYVDAVLTHLPWGGQQFTTGLSTGPAGSISIAVRHAPELVADVLDVLAQLGLLRGEEHRHDLSEEEAAETIARLRTLCGHPRYGTNGQTIRNRADLEFVLAHALAHAGADTGLRDWITTAADAIARYLDARTGSHQ